MEGRQVAFSKESGLQTGWDPRALIWLLALAMVALAACSRGEGDQVARRVSASVEAAKAPVMVEEPPQAGRCVRRQKALAAGEPEATLQVMACLRALALADRPEAVRQAQALLDGGVKADTGLMLGPLARALVAFPLEGQLAAYLGRLGVLSGKPAEASAGDLLTVEDYLKNQGRHEWFDVETGMFPNGHDALLAALAALADSGLSKAKFEEVPPKDPDNNDEPYTLIARLGERTYRVEAQNYGDWYDVGTVLGLLNRMAAENGYPERFITLDTGDQTAVVVAIGESALRDLSTKGLLEISAADRARILGKQFEDMTVGKSGAESHGH